MLDDHMRTEQACCRGSRSHAGQLRPEQFDNWLNGDMGVGELKPAPDNYLQRRPVSRRVNSSKADEDDSTLISQILDATKPERPPQ